MNNCKNPNCNKPLIDGLNYCSEECLRTHINLKQEERARVKMKGETPKKKNKIPFEKAFPISAKILEEEKEEQAIQQKEQVIEPPKENKYVHVNKQQYNEIQEIYDYFGFSHSEGTVIGKHNTSILSFLIREKEGIYDKMVNRLTWMCHMSRRYLLENYLKGIEDFGIIETSVNQFGVLKWKWVGIKALHNGSE